jgi:hypothetical protein
MVDTDGNNITNSGRLDISQDLEIADIHMPHDSQVIDCPHCQARVSCEPLAIVVEPSGYDEPPDDSIVFFAKCPACSRALLGRSDRIQIGPDSYDWTLAQRLWPDGEAQFDICIPVGVRRDLKEAKKCIEVGLYTAAAVMCGRALEGLMKDKSDESHLQRGLLKMKSQGVIDGRLFEWGELLRKERNIAAHASEELISKENCRDLFDFSVALCEYIYVLNDRYIKFQERKSRKG